MGPRNRDVSVCVSIVPWIRSKHEILVIPIWLLLLYISRIHPFIPSLPHHYSLQLSHLLHYCHLDPSLHTHTHTHIHTHTHTHPDVAIKNTYIIIVSSDKWQAGKEFPKLLPRQPWRIFLGGHDNRWCTSGVVGGFLFRHLAGGRVAAFVCLWICVCVCKRVSVYVWLHTTVIVLCCLQTPACVWARRTCDCAHRFCTRRCTRDEECWRAW